MCLLIITEDTIPDKMEVILVITIFLFATFISATFGFGTALISMPLLALVIDIRLATPLAGLVGMSVSILILLSHWKDTHFHSAGRLLLSALPGIILGILLLNYSDGLLLKLVLACVIIGFSLYKLFSVRQLSLKSDAFIYLFGFLAGILGGAFHMNGPPVIMYGTLRRWPPAMFRATLQSFFLPAGIIALAGQGFSGLLTTNVFRMYLFILPVIVLNVFIGNRLHAKIPHGKFNTAINCLLLLTGFLLLIQSVCMLAG